MQINQNRPTSYCHGVILSSPSPRQKTTPHGHQIRTRAHTHHSSPSHPINKQQYIHTSALHPNHRHVRPLSPLNIDERAELSALSAKRSKTKGAIELYHHRIQDPEDHLNAKQPAAYYTELQDPGAARYVSLLERTEASICARESRRAFPTPDWEQAWYWTLGVHATLVFLAGTTVVCARSDSRGQGFGSRTGGVAALVLFTSLYCFLDQAVGAAFRTTGSRAVLYWVPVRFLMLLLLASWCGGLAYMSAETGNV